MATDSALLQCIATVQALEAEVQLIKVPAMGRMSASALTATSAGLVGEHDMVATFDPRYTCTDPLHHSRTLMPQHYGDVGLIPVITEVYIGVADARGDNTHQDFVLSRAFHLDGFDLKGTTSFAQNGRSYLQCLHVNPFSNQAILAPSPLFIFSLRVKFSQIFSIIPLATRIKDYFLSLAQ
jgi:hypothetical protein